MYLVSGTGGSKLTAPVLSRREPGQKKELSGVGVGTGMPLTTSIKNQMLRLLRRTKSTRERPASSSIVFSNKRCLTSLDNVLLESSPKPIRPSKSVRQSAVSESMALGAATPKPPSAAPAPPASTPAPAEPKKSSAAPPHSRTYSREWHHRARRQSKQVSSHR
ncbi:unnamed protein product [Bemisia tabaci]|uniref:Uncharacterized protein n=1 Tax=Bemisia tabaci TaxID=7038 RepID=A0A9P0A2F1_BEMTA|nr:unnamed protein product [Bemisia tabaci]